MVVNIRLDNRWSLISDKRQWILALDGKATYFYMTLSGVLFDYLDMKLKSCNAKTIFYLLERQKQLIARLKRVLEPLDLQIKPLDVEVENEN